MLYLKWYRLRAHLTQKELGKQVGVSQSMISNWENGLEIPLTPLSKLHQVFCDLGVTPHGNNPRIIAMRFHGIGGPHA